MPGQYTVYTGAGRGAQFFYSLLRLPSQPTLVLPYMIGWCSTRQKNCTYTLLFNSIPCCAGTMVGLQTTMPARVKIHKEILYTIFFKYSEFHCLFIYYIICECFRSNIYHLIHSKQLKTRKQKF